MVSEAYWRPHHTTCGTHGHAQSQVAGPRPAVAEWQPEARPCPLAGQVQGQAGTAIRRPGQGLARITAVRNRPAMGSENTRGLNGAPGTREGPWGQEAEESPQGHRDLSVRSGCCRGSSSSCLCWGSFQKAGP